MFLLRIFSFPFLRIRIRQLLPEKRRDINLRLHSAGNAEFIDLPDGTFHNVADVVSDIADRQGIHRLREPVVMRDDREFSGETHSFFDGAPHDMACQVVVSDEDAVGPLLFRQGKEQRRNLLGQLRHLHPEDEVPGGRRIESPLPHLLRNV